MGRLIEGRWVVKWHDIQNRSGRFVRAATQFRQWIRADGTTPFRPEAGRYHLYVSLACPWAHRTLIFRRLKKLEETISVSVVHPLMLENGWVFAEGHVDPVNGARFLYEIYQRARADYSGRVTVPVLWDRETETIVNNESAEIIRMLNSEFDDFGDSSRDFYPEPLREEIDAINTLVYDTVNNGVYKVGFASTQEAHDEAVTALFETLDLLEDRLAARRWLVGETITEADWRLFTTLLRFDPVYHGHFKCNIRRIVDYPNLYSYIKRLYAVEGVAETVDIEQIKRHYYGSHRTLNPRGIIPKGPAGWLE